MGGRQAGGHRARGNQGQSAPCSRPSFWVAGPAPTIPQGTVKRNVDSHFIHANIDTDVIVTEVGSAPLPTSTSPYTLTCFSSPNNLRLDPGTPTSLRFRGSPTAPSSVQPLRLLAVLRMGRTMQRIRGCRGCSDNTEGPALFFDATPSRVLASFCLSDGAAGARQNPWSQGHRIQIECIVDRSSQPGLSFDCPCQCCLGQMEACKRGPGVQGTQSNGGSAP